MRPRSLRLLAIAASLALPGLAALAQEAQVAQDEVFTETVQVNVVNVDVYVADKNGVPVTGLGRDDFEILEDGRPQRISNFFAFEGRRPVGQPDQEQTDPEEEGTAPPSAVPGRVAPPPVPEEQRLSLVVYIDNFNIRPFNRNRVFRRLREFLHQSVEPGDRVMLVSYDRSLHIRQPFTSEPALVSSALFDMEKLTGAGLFLDFTYHDISFFPGFIQFESDDSSATGLC